MSEEAVSRPGFIAFPPDEIRRLREREGLTIEGLAAKAGVMIFALHRAEQGLPVSVTIAKLIKTALPALSLDLPLPASEPQSADASPMGEPQDERETNSRLAGPGLAVERKLDDTEGRRMWIVLLDCSGSMAERFTSDEWGKDQTRLQTAKAELIEQLGYLPSGMPVAVIAFANDARHVITAEAGAANRFRQRFEELIPGGGTNIGAALDAAADLVEHSGRPPSAPCAPAVASGPAPVD